MTRAIPRAINGIALGPLGFGGAPLGNLFAPIDEDAAIGAVRRAYETGIRHFDTAPHYGHGLRRCESIGSAESRHESYQALATLRSSEKSINSQILSEHRFGEVLRRVPRDSFVLSTKVGRLLTPDPRASLDQHGFARAMPFNQRYDYSADGARRSLEFSLHRFGLARVDIAYIHDCDAWAHGAEGPRRFQEAMAGAYPALAQLKREGVVAAIGLGVNASETCRDALRHGDFDLFLLAGRYTLLEQGALDELLPACVERGIGIVIGGPFNSGILATGAIAGARYNYAEAPPDIMKRVAAIERVCTRHRVPLKAAALQFPLAHPAVVAAIPGARTPSEVDDNATLMRFPIPVALWAELKAERLLRQDAPTP